MSAHWGMDVAVIEVLQIVSFGMNPLVKIGSFNNCLNEDLLSEMDGMGVGTCVFTTATDDSVCLTFCESVDTEIDDTEMKRATGE